MVYNLSLTDLSEQQRLSWYSPDEDVKMCLVKGKDEEACQNYIRILVSPGPGRLQICGTNSFRPMCRQYQVGEQNYTVVSEKNGQVVCPYDPKHNSTAVFVGTLLFVDGREVYKYKNGSFGLNIRGYWHDLAPAEGSGRRPPPFIRLSKLPFISDSGRSW